MVYACVLLCYTACNAQAGGAQERRMKQVEFKGGPMDGDKLPVGYVPRPELHVAVETA
jgi:hypothetical protein